jgi:hypothetical protein
MTATEPDNPRGWKVLGFGKHEEIAAEIQQRLRAQGLRARTFALTDDPDGDARLIRELAEETYDGIAIGSFINGQDPTVPPTEHTTRWFNRILNITQSHAPGAKIILVPSPPEAVFAIERVLGPIDR